MIKKTETIPLTDTNNIKLSFVTVVYDGELPLLELQARSIECFIPDAIIEEIIILVNDVNEEHVIQKIKSAYLNFYGQLSKKVRVLRSEEVFTHSKTGWFNSFLAFWAKKPQYRFRKKRGGWFGNNGWAMQQAFKLCSARVTKASHIVMLDTKNVFIQELTLNAFVDDLGKARTNLIPLVKLHKRWLPPSFKALKYDYAEGLLPKTTQFITPFVIEKKVLCELLAKFEQHHDSVQGVFARRFIKPTEFMLINVFCKKTYGELTNIFSEGLVQAKSFYTSTTAEQVDLILSETEQGNIQILGLHITVIGRMMPLQLKRLKALLVSRGIINTKFDMVAMKAILLQKNEDRIKKSQEKLPRRNKTK